MFDERRAAVDKLTAAGSGVEKLGKSGVEVKKTTLKISRGVSRGLLSWKRILPGRLGPQSSWCWHDGDGDGF